MGLIMTKNDNDIQDINDLVESPIEGAQRLTAFDMSELKFNDK